MDEASKLLEDITVSHQRLPTGYCKLSLDMPLVDKVVDLVLTSVDPTLPLKSEVQVVDSDSSVVDPTLPLKSEVKVIELTSSPLDPTLSSKNVKTEVVPSTEYYTCLSLLIESENHPVEVFIVSFDYSMQEDCLFRHKPLQVVRLFPLTGVT